MEWNYLYKIDPKGAILAEIDISQYVDTEAGEYFYANQMVASGEDEIIVLVNNNFWIFNEKGLKTKLTDLAGENYFSDMYHLDDGRILVGSYMEKGYQLFELDVKAGKLSSEPISLPGGRYQYNVLCAGEGSQLYLNDENGLSVFDLESGEVSELINWINSDIDTSSVYNFVPLKDGRIFGTGYDPDTSKEMFVLLTKKPEDQIKPQVVLTLGCEYIDYNLRRAIIAYNRQGGDYRISIKTYSQYNTEADPQGGMTRFNNDLVSGSIPDLIVINESMPYDSYAAKGLFADLYQLMDQDESFVRDNYLTNVMEARSTNGKLYRMCTSFYVTTLAGAASRVGNEPGWTMQEMMQALNAAEGATLFANQTRETLQYQILSPMISQFIDSDTGRCSFDSQEFIDLITYIASAPESSSNGARLQ